MRCKICKAATHKISEQLILQKYQVAYHQCKTCHFIQTDQPFWLAESYENVITALDIGLINRNIYLQKEISKIIDLFFPDANIMLDYGGGYGMFVRMMRDLGYNFFRQDSYCQNLFANYFDYTDTASKKYDVLTTFEVFEHLEDPLTEIEKMFTFSDNIIFSTVLIPADIKEFETWWYVSPLIGQHIAFYDIKTLQYLADKFGKKLYSNNQNLHVLTSHTIEASIVNRIFNTHKKSKLKKIINLFCKNKQVESSRTSLLQKDYEFIEKTLIAKK
ncbi:MAG: class I SAM-dependent methyltransferase [Bacteroidia bacterium]